ncbi:hypothetical protein Tco_0233430 [Tanacetum coccineum]
MSFDMPASLEYLSSLAHASSTERHPDSAIDDPKPVDGSYRMSDVRRLSAHVVKLRDMLEGVLVLSGLSHIWKSQTCDPLWRLPIYYTPAAAVVPDPTPEELAVSNPSHVAKHTRCAMAQSSGSTTRPNRFADDSGAESDDDDNACYEVPIVTPIRYATFTGSWGKGIMTDVDAAAAPSVGASRPRVSSGPAPSFRELSGDAIHRDFFPFSPGPYYATYPEGGIDGNYEFTHPSIYKTVVDQFPTPGEMVRIKALSSDQLTAKMSILHCLMMSYGGELLAWYHGLLQSHHDYVQLTDSRLKGYQENFASLTGRLPSAAIDDPRPAAGSFNMVDVRRLSAHVIKMRDMPEGVLVLFRSALAQSSGSTTRPSLFVDNSDDGSDDDDACVEIPLVTPIHSAAVIPSLRNQGGSSAAPAAEGPGTRDSWGKGIMADDAAAPSVGVSRSRPSSEPAPSFRDVSGDAILTDLFPFFADPYYATYPEGGVAGNCEFTREEWDALCWPTFGVLTKEVFKDIACATLYDDVGGELLSRYHGLNQSHHEYVLLADSRLKGYEEKVTSLTGLELQVSTLKKQVSRLNYKLSSSDASFVKSKDKGKERKNKIKSLTKNPDNLHAKVACLSADLNWATNLEAKKDEEILRLKATPPEISSFFRGQFQGLVRKFLASDEFSRVQGELLSLAASAGFERGLSMHRTKDEFAAVLKKMANFMPGAQDRLAKASPLLEPKKLDRPTNVPTLMDARVSPPIAKESTMTLASGSSELSTNVVPAPSTIASEQNEKWVNAMVDEPDAEMNDGAAHSKSGGVFMQGTSHVLDDAAEVTVVGSKRVSSGLTDVVMALSAGEKGDGSLPSSVVDEEATTNPSRV